MNQRTRIHAVAAAAILVVSLTGAPAFAETCMNPSIVPVLDVSDHEVCWSSVPGSGEYDAVVGLSLRGIHDSNLGLVQASFACLANATRNTCVPVPFDPPAGDGFFFLVRTTRGNPRGSYSTSCPAEALGRNLAVASASLCP